MNKATIAFPADWPDNIRDSLKSFILSSRPGIDFIFETDPDISRSTVKSLEAPSGAFGSIAGDTKTPFDAQMSGIEQALKSEYRRLKEEAS